MKRGTNGFEEPPHKRRRSRFGPEPAKPVPPGQTPSSTSTPASNAPPTDLKSS